MHTIQFCVLEGDHVEVVRCEREPSFTADPLDPLPAQIQTEIVPVQRLRKRGTEIRYAVSALSGRILVDPIARGPGGFARGWAREYFSREEIIRTARDRRVIARHDPLGFEGLMDGPEMMPVDDA